MVRGDDGYVHSVLLKLWLGLICLTSCCQLITIKKVGDRDYASPFNASALDSGQKGGSTEPAPDEKGEQRIPAHKDFREKYFRGFRKDEELSKEKDVQEQEGNMTE